MSKFAAAMNASAYTWNGALSYASPDTTNQYSGRVSLFFKGVRGLNVPRLYEYLGQCARESVLDTFLLAFRLRDCRGGSGERLLGRHAFFWLFINYPDEFKKIMSLIPRYGRWDDLVCLFPGAFDLTDAHKVQSNFYSSLPSEEKMGKLRLLQQEVVMLVANQLRNDLANMNEGKSCSLCSKWVPTEGSLLDKKYGTFKVLADALQVSPRNLRRMYNTPLRAYLKVVETYICSGLWDKVDYNKVPSNAMKRLKNAFQKHSPERFDMWTNQLKLGNPKVAKVNAKQLYPHELIREVRTRTANEVTEAQWKVLVDEVRKLGSLSDAVVVVDTSGSMADPNYIPLDVAVSLGLIISDVVTGPFHGHVISFNTVPAFTVIPDASLRERWNAVSSMKWGGSTDIEKTFKLIVDRGSQCGLSQKEMPKRLFIISDMQFNSCSSKTNWERINEIYAESGYVRPQIVFWNVNGDSTDFPITVDENNTAMISGFSPSIIKALLKGEQLTPMIVVRNALDDPRYDPVRTALQPELPVRSDEDYEVISPLC